MCFSYMCKCNIFIFKNDMSYHQYIISLVFGSKHALIICNFHYFITIHHRVMPKMHCFQINYSKTSEKFNNLDLLKKGFLLLNIF